VPGSSILGHPVLRLEDSQILSGAARYVDDLVVPDGLHAVFVRSTVAHARLGPIDAEPARAVPGVAGVFTAPDLGLDPLPPFTMAPEAMARPPLAAGVVRFVGEAIAVVVAETKTAAVDAAGEVIVDYDPLPAVVDPERSLEPSAPLLFPDHGSNLVLEYDFGTLADVFDGADVVVSERFRNQRLSAVPLEVHGCVAVPEADGRLTLWVSNQHPFGVRAGLAPALKMDPDSLRVVCPAVGGGFGAKIGNYPEYVVVAAVARRLGRPVRWVESRSESMTAMTQGRGQIQDVEVGARADGTLVGLRVHVVADAGAYPAISVLLTSLTRLMACGVYTVPKVEFKARVVATNTTPVGAYRGAGRPEAAALVERAVDLVADELGLDPVDVRRRNFIPADAFPYTTATGATYDAGDYARALDEAVRLAGYEDLRREQAARRERGDRMALGIGVSTYVEVTGAGPVPELASCTVDAGGGVTVTVGTSPQGQGHETAFAQIVAATLDVPLEAVRVVHSDTGAVESGQGTYGSRSLQLGGSSVLRAAEAVLDQARERAAELLEANPADITTFEGGRIGVAGSPATAPSLAEVAAAAPDGLSAKETFPQAATTFPFGAHVAVVEIDTETGRLALLRHVAVDDCGRVLNPILAEGQVHGGLAQGIAQALWEEVVHDADGTPLTTTLADYLVPSAAELVSFETGRTETPTPLNPLGAKGIGESGTIGSTPAIQNAVVDALAHLGIRHVDMPASPERLWRAITSATGSG
jgi:aerobic carbon-monoxide dehydrogenase large subunit